uniref:Uncharacterized protein n=1 Tax=Rhizophora mucronata TaxID=61149 RepID=A0A2P2N1V3_RHIMU
MLKIKTPCHESSKQKEKMKLAFHN